MSWCSSRCPSMSGSGMCLANHCGWYQILDPMIAMMAGTSVSLTTKASRKTPAAKLKPDGLDGRVAGEHEGDEDGEHDQRRRGDHAGRQPGAALHRAAGVAIAGVV